MNKEPGFIENNQWNESSMAKLSIFHVPTVKSKQIEYLRNLHIFQSSLFYSCQVTSTILLAFKLDFLHLFVLETQVS